MNTLDPRVANLDIGSVARPCDLPPFRTSCRREHRLQTFAAPIARARRPGQRRRRAREGLVHVRLKDLSEQVVVITGASSGIGLCTATMAADRGARVVLAARDAEGLDAAVRAIRAEGGEAVRVVADVSSDEDAARIAETAIATFGRIDTWVNNAGVSVYGRLADTPVEEGKRLFDVNFWGVVNGCNAAIPHLREHGGALINLGSMVSDQAIPLQGIYVATKHAVKGYTDTLRLELEEDRAPISVTLIKPAAIDTPLFEHATSHIGAAPRPTPPVYAPEVVARAILSAAERPVRELFAGGAARVLSGMGVLAPRLTDRYLERAMFDSQAANRPARESSSLYEPSPPYGRVRGRYAGRVMRSSAYTTARLHPAITAAVVAGVVVGLWAMRRQRTR
jgi:short-subunit dehydrogenase